MAKLSYQEVNLLDQKSADRHAADTGYDYNKNSAKINVIHENALLLRDYEEKPLPRPGIIDVNGTKIQVKQVDIDAYCALRPQVCATGGTRAAIIDVLSAGASTVQEPNPEETLVPPTEVEETEDSTPEQPGPSNPQIQTDESATPSQPPLPTSPTHKVKVSSNLALRNSPSWTDVDESANKDNDKKGTKLAMLPNGTQFIVVDEATGHKCEWMKVVVEGYEQQSSFLYKKFTEKLESTKESAEYKCSDKSIPDIKSQATDWTHKEPSAVWFEKSTASWCTVVETEHKSTGGNQLTQRMSDSIDFGLWRILSENSKEGGSTTYEDADAKTKRESLQDSFIFARAEDWFLSPRPDSNLKILICLPHKYLDALGKMPEVEMVQTPEGTESPSIIRHDIEATMKYSMSFLTSRMREEAQELSSTLRRFGVDISNFDGSVEYWDGEEEASSIDQLMSSTNKLFSANNVSLNESADDVFEIGLDENYVVVYAQVRFKSTGATVVFANGMRDYILDEPMSFIRSAGFLYLRHEINNKGKDMPWTDFITSYTVDDKPKIIPSKPSEQSDIDTSPKTNPWSFTMAEMDIDFIKTDSQRVIEDGKLKDKKLREAVFKSRLKYSDPVMDKWSQPDGLLDALNCVRKEPESSQLEAAFQCVINKVSIEDLMMQALACINIQLPEVDVAVERWEEIKAFKESLEKNWDKIEDIGEGYYEYLKNRKKQKFKLPKVPTMNFPDDLAVEDIMGSLVEAIGKALLSILIQSFVSLITNLLEGLIIECQQAEGLDSYGSQDINDGLDNGIDPASGNDVTPEGMDKRLEDLLEALGVLPFANTSPLTDGLPNNNPEVISPELNEQVGVVRNMLSDLSAILTPFEMCLLLQGSATRELLTIVGNFLNLRYPPADRRKKWTPRRIKKMFAALGGMIDSSYCDQITNPVSSVRYSKSICDEEGIAQSIRRELYKKKSGSITGEDQMTEGQIEEALKKIRERKKAKAAALEKALLDPNGNFGIPKVGPDVFCTPDGNTTGKEPNAFAGLIQEDHSSVKHLQDKVIDTMMHGPYIAFADDVRDFPTLLVRDEVVSQTIEPTITTKGDDTTEIVNPVLGSMGFANMDLDIAKGMSPFSSEGRKRSVAPQLRKALNGFETNDSFTMSRTRKTDIFGKNIGGRVETVYGEFPDAWLYELNLPSDPMTNAAFDRLEESLSGLKDIFTDQQPTVEQLREAQSFISPSYKVFYALPIATANPFIDLDEEEILKEIRDLYAQAEEAHAAYASAQAALAAQGEESDPCGEFDRDAALEQIKQQISQQYEVGADSFSLWGDPPSFKFETTEYDPKWDDEWVLTIAKNPDTNPEILFSIYNSEPLSQAVTSQIENIQRDVGTDIATVKNASPQQQIFGDYVRKIWQVDTPINSGITGEIMLDMLSSFYKTPMFEEISRDTMKFVAKRIAESPYFQMITNTVEVKGQSQLSETPLMSMLNLSPAPTEEQRECGYDPHLLKINEEKEKAKEDFRKNNCPGEGPQSLDGLGGGGGPLQDSICQLTVKLLIRTYIIDYLLRGIFSLSAFTPKEDVIDGLITKYIAKMIEVDLKKYGEEVFTDIVEVADNMYAKHLDDERDDDEVSETDSGELPTGAGIEWQVKNQIIDIRDELADVIGTKLTTDDIDSVFLDKLPMFEVAEPEEEIGNPRLLTTRFSKPRTGELGLEGGPQLGYEKLEQLSGIEGNLEYAEFRQTEEIQQKGNADSFNIKNGELFVERYWRVWMKTSELGKISFEQVGERFKGEQTQTAHPWEDQQMQIQRLLKEHMERWGWSGICEEGKNDQNLGLSDSRGDKSESGVISSREITTLLVSMKDVNEEITLEDLFKKVRYGHRIMHLPPTSDDNFSTLNPIFASMWTPDTAKDVVTTDYLHNDNKGVYNFSFLSNNVEEKFFILERSHEVYEVMLEAQMRQERRVTGGTENTQTAFMHLVRPIFCTPLVDRELNVRFSGTPAAEIPSGDWSIDDSIHLGKWDKFLARTPEYKLLFDYVFPLERYFSLMTIFSIQGVSSMRGVESAFDTTIEEFIKLFKICHNAGDYTYVDENIMCAGFNPGIKQQVDNIPKIGGILADCLPDLGFGVCLQGIGMAFPLKFAFKTPLLILKAVIEIFDPLISLGKLVQISLKLAGVCLPIPAISFALLPVNIFMPPPIGIGIGPPLTPLGIIYMALGFGMIDLGGQLGGDSLGGDFGNLKLPLIDLNTKSSKYNCTADEKLLAPHNKKGKKIGVHGEKISPTATQMNMQTLVKKLNNSDPDATPKEALNDFFQGTRKGQPN